RDANVGGHGGFLLPCCCCSHTHGTRSWPLASREQPPSGIYTTTWNSSSTPKLSGLGRRWIKRLPTALVHPRPYPLICKSGRITDHSLAPGRLSTRSIGWGSNLRTPHIGRPRGTPLWNGSFAASKKNVCGTTDLKAFTKRSA